MEAAISCNFPCRAGAARYAAPRMPEPFRHRLRVRWSECDLQGVVFYPNYLAYFDHAITELWREAIGPYAEMRDLGIDMVVAEAGITLPRVGALRRRDRPGGHASSASATPR